MSYQSQWDDRKQDILDAATRVKDQNPGAWEEVKVPGQKSRRFISLVAAECQSRVSVDIGCNLKRGGPDVSLDVLAMPNPSGCRDATGTYPGLELRDIIGNAERADANISWGDATQATIDSGNPGGWIKTGIVAPPAPAAQPPGREEALNELNWLDAYYASPEGLQRPQGLSLNGKPDFEGIAAWFIEIYQRERMAGKSPAGARIAYVTQIRQSAEWLARHPGETP